ncbi:MAG TPA: nitrile hydratase accessory protein [Acidimicrobiales bacterium]|nr:nitrile hydratase accessory protein [Acidimicrobiales bacterium]
MSFDAWTGEGAPPRDNGELVFAEPWHARAFAMAVALVEQLAVPWTEFQSRLIAAIADAPEREYYDSWAAALESLVVDHGLSTTDAITAATPTERAAL